MPVELGLLAAFGAMIAWGLGDFFIQRSTRQIGDIESLAWIGLIGSIGLLPWVLPEIGLLLATNNLGFLVILGVLGFLIAMLNFEGYKQGKLSVVEVILEIELPITVAFGIFFLAESVSLIQLAVMALVFVGVVLIALPSLSVSPAVKKIERGVLLAFLAAIGMGTINFLTGIGAKNISPFLVIWIPWLVFTLICFALIAQREGFARFFQNGLKYKKTVIAEGVLDTAAWVFFAIALSQNLVSITTAITESYPAIGVLLGVWFNKEKIKSHQIAGAVLAIGSSIALAFWV